MAWPTCSAFAIYRPVGRPSEAPISLLRAKFPAAFTNAFGGVSEINVSCDVYSDSFGLECWLYAEDSAAGKKGDLMRIIYGPSARAIPRSVGYGMRVNPE